MFHRFTKAKKRGYVGIANPSPISDYQSARSNTCDICKCDVSEYYIVCLIQGKKHIVCGEQHYFDLIDNDRDSTAN